jgi:hypothetical protein
MDSFHVEECSSVFFRLVESRGVAHLMANALVWAQTGAIVVLLCLTAALLTLVWLLRRRLLAPPPESFALQRLVERLGRDVARMEADLARLSSATTQARVGIEEASVRAAKASHAAIEAASLVRDGAEQITLEAQQCMAAMTAALAGLIPEAAGPGDLSAPPPELAGHFSNDAEAGTVLASLADDLQALERFARDRKTIASESAAALMVALVEAIDRLNGVAECISATADRAGKDEAA